MQNPANTVLIQSPEYNKINMSEDHITTTSLGRLTPVLCKEVVPGDVVDCSPQFLTKFQPLMSPVFQNYEAMIDIFYVPSRVLWPNWEYFIQDEKAPGASATPVHPYVNLTGESNSLFNSPNWEAIYDYFGLYVRNNCDRINPLPFAAYQLIYNEYYRHPQIHEDNKEALRLVDGDNTSKLSLLRATRYRTYKNDYFTSALPSPQLGDQAALDLVTNSMLPVLRNNTPGGNIIQIAGTNLSSGAAANSEVENKITTDPNIGGNDLYVNPTAANFVITMNDLIELQRMQEFLVRKNVAGPRYIEYIKAIFGIDVPDLRLHRPDLIGSVKAPITVSEVLNTGNAIDQGYQTGQGNSYAEGGASDYKVLEHGYIIAIYNCRPQLRQMWSVEKFMFKNTFTDYYAPIFDAMGEEEILNKQLVLDHDYPDLPFGYIPKFADYRIGFNKVSGDFRTTLGIWHESPRFPTDVRLDEQFFDIFNPGEAFTTGYTLADSILLWVSFQLFITRPMKKYTMPVLSNQYGNNLI